MLKPLFTACVILTSIAASLTALSQSAQACNSAEDKIASPIEIKLDLKGFKTPPTQVKIGPNIYKLNAEIIQNRMLSIGAPSRIPKCVSRILLQIDQSQHRPLQALLYLTALAVIEPI